MKMKTVFFTVVAVCFWSILNIQAQSNNSIVINFKYGGNKLIIKTVNQDYSSTTREDKNIEIEVGIKKELDKWHNEGYRVENSYVFVSGGSGSSSSTVTFILRKDE